MRSIVADLAGSPVGEPVPVVVDDVVAIRSARRRALPQLVVEIRGHRDHFALPYSRSRIGVPGAREIRRADQTFTNQLQDLDEVRTRASLGAELHVELAMLARGCDDQLVLARIVPTRLFEVDVLAGVERENRGRRVPVIRRRHGNRIDALVFQYSAEVGHRLWRRRLQRRRLGERFGEDVGIDVAEVGDGRVGPAREILCVHHAASVQAHDRHRHLLGGRSVENKQRTDAARRGQRAEAGDRSLLQKIPAVQRLFRIHDNSPSYRMRILIFLKYTSSTWSCSTMWPARRVAKSLMSRYLLARSESMSGVPRSNSTT